MEDNGDLGVLGAKCSALAGASGVRTGQVEFAPQILLGDFEIFQLDTLTREKGVEMRGSGYPCLSRPISGIAACTSG